MGRPVSAGGLRMVVVLALLGFGLDLGRGLPQELDTIRDTRYGRSSHQEIIGRVKIQKKTKTLVFLICELKCNNKIITSASGVWKILKVIHPTFM